MGTKAIDPQSIRDITLLGDPAGTTRVAHRLLQHSTRPVSATTLHWTTDGIDHTIRLTELSTDTPIAELQRHIRVANGVIAVIDAAGPLAPRLETMLRVADDHQVARLCLITNLDHPAANFDRCIRAIAATRGATPLPLQFPFSTGTAYEGIIDLLSTWSLLPIAAETYGSHWKTAQQWYDALATAVTEQDASHPRTPSAATDGPSDHLHRRIRSLTRIGDIIPILCSATPPPAGTPALLNAIVRYLPSPLDVCQPEHALDY